MKNSQLNQNENKLHAFLVRTVSFIAFALAIIFAFVLAPVTTHVNSDATISYLPDVLEAILQLMHLIVFFTCFAITYFCMYRFSLKKSTSVIIIFSVATVCKYFLNMLSEIILAKAMGYDYVFETVPQSIVSVSVQSALELLQYAFVVIVGLAIFSKHKEREAVAKKNATKLNIEYDERNAIFPFKKTFSKSNRLQFCALMASAFVCAFRIAPRIYYDVFQILFFAAPLTLGDVAVMFIYYLSDVLFCLVGYFIMIFIFNKLDTKDLILRAKYSEQETTAR